MYQFLNSPFKISTLILPNRLIQGPLAGFSCAPFRILFNQFAAPAYTVTEMISAHDLVHKKKLHSRYIYRDMQEKCLAYQISGNQPEIMSEAAVLLQRLGADLIDLNCGCPKPKIRKKGSGSALLEKPELLIEIIQCVKKKISIPLTVKIRIQDEKTDLILASEIEKAGADALIVHGRSWTQDYEVDCNYENIAKIKEAVNIPVIANGDISDTKSLKKAYERTKADAFMISRAGTGRPWIFKELLYGKKIQVNLHKKISLLNQHVQALAILEGEHKANLQAIKLKKYYLY